MAEHDRLSAAPVLVKYLGAICGCDRRHGGSTPLFTSSFWGDANESARSAVRPDGGEPEIHTLARWLWIPGSRQEARPGMTDHANRGAGRNRRIAPIITMMKSTSTMP